MRVRALFGAFVFLCLFFGTNNSLYSQSTPSVENGVIDLSSYDFRHSSPVLLEGTWEFYWEQLLSPTEIDSSEKHQYRTFTESWNSDSRYSPMGYATYRATIKIPRRVVPLALSVPDFYSSYLLYVNNEIVSRNGSVGTSKEKYIPQWLPNTVALDNIDSDSLVIILQISNFDHSKGGAYFPIKLGSTEKLFNQRAIEYGYAFVLTGALLMGGLFFFGLYLFGRHETTILYFSLFCIIYSYRIIGFGSYPLHFLLPNIPWIVTLKLEYITLFLSGYIFGMYTLNLYPKESSKRLIYLLSGVSLLFIGITLLFPPSFFTLLVTPYFVILVSYILYAFYVYIRAVINDSPGAKYALISTGSVFFVFLYEILAYFGFAERILLLNFSGYLFFFFFQSLILSFRFANSLKLAKEKAEESSIAKSQFLSTMSHEIRTPLNAVIGLSGLLSESKLSEQQKEYSKIINQSGENLLGIINNILDYSKIESGKLELADIDFNIRAVVEQVLDLISSTNKNPDLELLYSVDDSVPDFVIGDSNRVQQVLINLLSNALKFTEQGEIYISVNLIPKETDGIVLEFKVKDTGIGIPQDQMHRLFQSFSQIDPSSTRKYGGTGLGLVISKKLVEAMGGSISVNSNENIGSTFSFNIKVEKSPVVSDLASSNLIEGKRVFVLDDNQTNLKILESQLSKAGIKTTTYNKPKKLIDDIAKLDSFDFGILDMQMPELTGVQVAKEIQKKWAKSELPLVLLSSIHDEEVKKHKNLFHLHLTKPIKHTALLRNLERIYRSGQHIGIKKFVSNYEENSFKEELSILIVEDNLINQKVLVRILDKLGQKADIANNGVEALNLDQSKKYDLIFMDMEMPEMDGIDATRKILSKITDTEKPTIIAITANARIEDKELCLSVGMKDFLSKPVTTEMIKKTLIKWFPVSQ